MIATIQARLRTPIDRDTTGVWIPRGGKTIAYSDGAASERYLRKAMQACSDLSSTSIELERWGKDWASEYHLTRRRSQLLRCLDYRRASKVVEVGCGCGAITRFLGESFDEVIGIEGSKARAELARLRTRDQDNVSIVCAPYQDVHFAGPVDVVFCIGVLEYAAAFVAADDPYRAVLKSFSELLGEDGQLVLAIENQFGLKYFSSSREDHTNRMFEGIEGYPRWGHKVRTFGYGELKAMLGEWFPRVEFYFPYPDYKIPTCVVSERLFETVDAGELVSQFRGRDYAGDRPPLFDERRATRELARNGQLPFFANSFLVVASKSSAGAVRPASLGVMYSADRAPAFSTQTRIALNADGQVVVDKQPLHVSTAARGGPVALRATTSTWQHRPSLQAVVEDRLRSQPAHLEDAFAPCRPWLEHLQSLQLAHGHAPTLPGRCLDAIWKNSFVADGRCVLVDTEWDWLEPLPLRVVVIRAVYCFLADLEPHRNAYPGLRDANLRRLITRIAAAVGVRLDAADFAAFVSVESRLQGAVSGRSASRIETALRLRLTDQRVVAAAEAVRGAARTAREQAARVGRGLRRLLPAGRG